MSSQPDLRQAPTILIVDDDADVRASVAEFLGDAGYETVCLSNGNAALAHMCQNPPPAAVLADMLMPGMNAWELVAQMRRREHLAKIPVIVVTGQGPQWGSPVPESMVVRKPIDTTRLLRLISQSVGARAGEGDSAASP
jgi:two-component system sensor histidine kinase/response regulator